MRAYEELERTQTPHGELLLVRRRVPGAPGEAAYEVKLAGALLMSSLVTESERALARLTLEEAPGRGRRVLVGGLGLGYTALEALEQPEVEHVETVELLPEVIAWHRQGLVPAGARLCGDPRCRLVAGDVFERLGQAPGPPPRFDVIALDVDHSPEALLRPAHGAFYAEEGLAAAAGHLNPGGVLGIWSALAPDAAFLARLRRVFPRARAEPISFFNPNNDAEEVNTVYLGLGAGAARAGPRGLKRGPG